MVRNRGPQIKNSVFNHDDGTVRHRLSHLTARYEQCNNHCINYRHSVDYCINCVLGLHPCLIVLLVVAPQTFLGISRKNIFNKHVHRKLPCCMKINPIRFVLAQFYSKKAMIQPLCFDIEYWRSYSPFLSWKLQWSKIQNIYIVSLYWMLYRTKNEANSMGFNRII